MIGVDFFCGVGGLTRGLLHAGINMVLGIDNDEECKETYEKNNSPSKFLLADIEKIQPNDILNYIGKFDSRELMFVACAPCQPFAQLNKHEERSGEATLLGRFMKFVQAFRPHQVFIENVPGIAKVPGRSTFRRVKKMLSDWGYSYAEGILDAKAYGVPQTRRRLVLLAMIDAEPTLPEPTYGPGLMPYVTVKDAIGDYPPLKAGESHMGVPNHKAARLSPKNLQRLECTPIDGGDRSAWPEELWLDCHKNQKKGSYSDTYGRMSWNLPSPTLTCRCYSISNGRYGHPEQNRAITFREAAKLQTFPDNYIFYSPSHKVLGKQIGNAVPVALAEAIGRHILALRRI